MKPTDVIIAPGVEFTGTFGFTTWEQDQAQRAQVERARRIRAERDAEQAELARAEWLARLGRR